MASTPSAYGRVGINPFRHPIADVVEPHIDAQWTNCRKFEMNYHKCMEAFGYHLGVRHCDLEWRDFEECIHDVKKINRYVKIRLTRSLQFFKGERDRPCLKGYPHPYFVNPDWYDENGIYY